MYSPPVTYDAETAWEMLDIADHLECKPVLRILRASLEKCGGKFGISLHAVHIVVAEYHSETSSADRVHLSLDTAVTRLLQTDRLALPNCMAACERVILAQKKDVPDLHILPVERLIKLLLR